MKLKDKRKSRRHTCVSIAALLVLLSIPVVCIFLNVQESTFVQQDVNVFRNLLYLENISVDGTQVGFGNNVISIYNNEERNENSKTLHPNTLRILQEMENEWSERNSKIDAFDKVNFIPTSQIKRSGDFFSASWWQNKERFLSTFEPEHIDSVEGAVFRFIYPASRRLDLRMTSDWLKFSVEHLSRTWKIAGFKKREETQSYDMFVDKLFKYTTNTLTSIRNSPSPPGSDSTSSLLSMLETIAVIPSMPYGGGRNATRGQVMTTANLAATLTSLIRVSCGRILIVIDHNDMNTMIAPIFLETKKILQREFHNPTEGSENQRRESELYFTSPRSSDALDSFTVNKTSPFEFMVHKTEIALVIVNCTEENGTKAKRMKLLPKAALLGLKDAFVGVDMIHSRQWLGADPRSETYNNRWNYVYLTEPDTILYAKHESMPALSREVQQGKIIVPHRLQPLPHERDLPGYYPDRMVPATGNFSNVLSMGANGKCCDAGPVAPGFVKITVCNQFWWQCGFGPDPRLDLVLNASQRHFRLSHYNFMSLQQGTDVVTLAGNEHGRPCIPMPAAAEDDNDCS